MKFTRRGRYCYLENVTKENIRFANLAGRMTGSPYDDPNNPKHVYVLWVDDPDVVSALREENVVVKEVPDKDNPDISRFSVQLKAYPKMRVNRNTGKEEQYPKVMMSTNENTVRLEVGSFGLVDGLHVESMDIAFHTWQYNQHKPDCIAVIDELWAKVDEGAGETDDRYLAEKYGYEEEEEVPFE